MKLKLFIFVFAVFAVCSAKAQTAISGKLTAAKDGNAITGAAVTVHLVGSDNILGYSISNSVGEYRVAVSTSADSVDVRVSYLGYATQMRRVATRTQSINFALTEQDFTIREVKVKAPKVRMSGDTITYDASQYRKERDRTLVDFIERMPGVEVNKETGGIKYQGKSINKFYVENMDLMGGRYGEISKNLPANAVKSVELYENHQPTKVLQGISFSDKAAMNIKLKDNAKGRWIGNGITAGAGFSPLLWKAEFTAMRFAGKMQTYLTYKTNNIGQDIEIYDHFGGIIITLMGEANTSAFYSPFISSPSLSAKRSLFNRTHVASINNLWKLNDDSNIRFNIDYKNEEKQQDSRQSTTYYLPGDSSYVYEEKNRVRSHTNRLKGALTYTQNAKTIFLENKLTAAAEWQKINSTISNDGQIGENLHLPSFKIGDNLRIIKRTSKDNRYTFATNNSYENLPQKLMASINSPAAGFNDFTQQAKIQKFSSENTFAFGHFIKRVNVSYIFGYNFDYNEYNTGATKHRRNKNDVSASATLSYKTDKLRASLALPVDYIDISGSDSIPTFSGVVFSPSMFLTYSIASFWEASLTADVNSTFDDIHSVVSGVMKDYRTRYVFNGVFPRRNSVSVRGGLRYRNPIEATFANIDVSYQYGTNRNTSEQIVNGANITNRVIAGRTQMQVLGANGGMSKMFDWQRCSARLDWSVFHNRSEMLRSGTIIPIKSLSFSITPKIDIETFANQSLSYSCTFSASRTTIASNKNPFMRNICQNFSYYIPISKTLDVTMIGEHVRNQVGKDNYVNMFLMDALVRWRAAKRVEFSLSWNNIFDTKEYSYSYYDDLSFSSYSYKLRPTNVLLIVNFKFR